MQKIDKSAKGFTRLCRRGSSPAATTAEQLKGLAMVVRKDDELDAAGTGSEEEGCNSVEENDATMTLPEESMHLNPMYCWQSRFDIIEAQPRVFILHNRHEKSLRSDQ
jgi:hypothetical protein